MAMRGVPEVPVGLTYRAELLDPTEERALLESFASLELEAVVMRGQVARRTVRHFGFTYAFESWALTPTEEIPTYLHQLRERSAHLAGVRAGDLRQALVTRYPAGATIGWHRDAAAFGSTVVGVSLGSACVMRFQRTAAGGERRVHEQLLQARSGYVLSGAARFTWQHSIPPVTEERYSVTFRTVRAA